MMSQFTKQFAIIEKLKSLVKRSTYSFLRKSDDSNQISEEVAKKIQKSSYDISHAKTKDVFTPPYKAIEEQLEVEEDQIFRAAVFNLANIALNSDKYAVDIIKVLEKAQDKNQRTSEQLDYINNKISVIKKTHSL